jgi:hypothetical protein
MIEVTDVREQVEGLRSAFEARSKARRAISYPNLAAFPLAVQVEFGRRYAKIVVAESSSRRVAGFVDLTNGGILYAASWKGPKDLRPRGSVLASDFGLSAFGDYGVNSLGTSRIVAGASEYYDFNF